MATRTPGTPPNAPLLRSLLAAEGAAGRYHATLGVLHLTSALLQAACPAPALATIVSFFAPLTKVVVGGVVGMVQGHENTHYYSMFTVPALLPSTTDNHKGAYFVSALYFWMLLVSPSCVFLSILLLW